MSKKSKKKQRAVAGVIPPVVVPDTAHTDPAPAPGKKAKHTGVHFKDTDVAGVNKPEERANLFVAAAPPPGVVPAGVRGQASLAADNAAITQMTGYAGGIYQGIAGRGFLGYPMLADLSQRPEFRHISETVAREMTRKWITLHASGESQKDSTDKIGKIKAEFDRLKLQDHFRRVVELDGFFGRGHLYLDFGNDSPAELKTMLIVDKAKINPRRPLLGVKVIEPTWTYPKAYNAVNPLADDYFKPQSWWVMGKEIHRSRLMTFVSREMPDLLKSAYSFGGMSLTQMAKPYVDHWIRTRDSVSDLIHSFSIMVLSTPMQQLLSGGGGRPLINRVAAFNKFRDNRGTFVVDKEQEDLKNISAPLGTLDKLLAQSQEQMASVSQIPIVKLLGVTPSGLNPSTDGEIRVFYDNINAMQHQLFAQAIRTLLNIVQLSLFGMIDPDIDFSFASLWQMDEAQKATIRKQNADTAAVYIGQGVIEAAEERQRIADEDGSPYTGLDLTKEIEAPGQQTGYNDGDPDDDNPGGGVGGGPEDGSGGGNRPPAGVPRGGNGGDRPSINDVKFGRDENPGRTLYVHRPVKSNVDLRSWAKEMGITLDDKLHVTLAYSNKPFPWDTMAEKEPLSVIGERRKLMQLGDKLVLTLDDPQLHERWKRIGDLGATWDFPTYIPHMSLCDYDDDIFDLDNLYPFNGRIELGPEKWEEISQTNKFAEDAKWYEEDHKRDNGGKFTSGGAGHEDKTQKLHNLIKQHASEALGNRAKSKLSEIGQVKKDQKNWDDVDLLSDPKTPLHHVINDYIKHHKNGSNTKNISNPSDGYQVKTDTTLIPENMQSKLQPLIINGEADNPKAMKKLSEYARIVKRNLSPEQKKAAHEYSMNFTYLEINRVAGGQPATYQEWSRQSTLNTIKDLKSAIAKSRIPADMNFARGINASLLQILGTDDVEQAVGKVFQNVGFGSCTPEISLAKKFAKGAVLIKFNLPAGTPALTIGGTPGQHLEMVTNVGSGFRVDRVEPGVDGVNHVLHCTYLGEKS